MATTIYKSEDVEVSVYKSYTIRMINTEWGWYVQVSDGYCSDYMSKKEAKSRRREILNEIKNGHW